MKCWWVFTVSLSHEDTLSMSHCPAGCLNQLRLLCHITGILIIHTSKFYKTRLVPLGPDLTRGLKAYATKRAMQHSSGPEGPFFVSRTGSPLTRRAAEHTFSRLRLRASVLRHDGARYQPRLHDLRHYPGFRTIADSRWRSSVFNDPGKKHSA